MTDIPKNIYQALPPKQRAVACFAAINRKDQVETDRLMQHAPRSGGHGKAILAMSQAVEAYGMVTSRAVIDLLLVAGRSLEASSFCCGWAAAGGALDNDEYLKNCAIVELLAPVIESREGELNAVRQAGAEWCEKNGIPKEIFSGILCPFLPQMADGSPVCGETLEVARSLFQEITLTW